MLAHGVPSITKLSKLLKPVVPQRELHGVNTRVWRSKTGIGDVFITRAQRDRSFLTGENMQSKGGVRQEIGGRIGDHRHIVAGEENAAAKLQVRDQALGSGEVPGQVHRVKGSTVR